MNPYYPKLFEPITIGRTTFRNRIWSAPNMMSHMDYRGRPDDSMIAYYREKAMGGAAVVTLGDCPVDREHAATNPRSFALTPENQPMLAEIAKAIHEGGALASQELNHGGNVAFAEANYDANPEGWEAWGPVEVHKTAGGVLHGEEVAEEEIHIHGMSEADMNVVADRFADCAELLKTAGFDMVLLHGGHGWLLDQFISPLYNTRTDEYGGSVENRAKFPLMVIDRIRQRCGRDFLIEYRMSGAEEIEGGLSKAEGIEFAKLLDGKVDIIHVSAGLDTEEAQAVHTHPTMFLPHGVNVHYAADIKAAGVKTPVLTLGGINTPKLAEQILAEGKADIIGFSRALIADPHFPDKAKHGHPEDIIPCLRCLDCLTGLHEGNNLCCAVNPRTAREERYDRIKPAAEKRKVLVVGGGPGGMQAAATAAQRGHDVTLAEATDRLGGLLKFTDYDDLKIDLMRLKDHLIAQVEKSGAKVLYNTTVTPEFVRAGGYDAVIVAAGSSPAKPPIPGLELAEHATTVYTKLEGLGKNVAVLGGGLVGCETGLFLAEHGHNVTIIEMQSAIAPEANWMHREGMMQAFAKAPITCRTGLRVSKVERNAVTALDETGAEVVIPVDSVVYAMGMRPNTATVEQLRDTVIDVIPVGDCVKARKARQAMEEGFWAAVRLA
ncbi:MAG: FAD-dependent oxidoreductase [Oscillospiraceae bacterium]|nr:FAD-dependent oxidoreductase [Oscillospiraceae bacterium]